MPGYFCTLQAMFRATVLTHGAKKAKKDEQVGFQNEKCDYGKRLNVSDEWLQETERKLCEYTILGETSPRDFDKLVSYFDRNPDLVSAKFVILSFAMATDLIVEGRKYQYAENVCDLALMADVFVKHGVQQVKKDVRLMEEQNEMTPYLCDLYIDLRKTNDQTRILGLLSKKIPCNCLEDIRRILHAEGKERKECCDICYRVVLSTEILTCSRCKVELYCSHECQLLDYKKHKVMCKRLASAMKKT